MRVPAGDLTIKGVTGNKDVSLLAGDLTLEVGDPGAYGPVDASVRVGDLDARPFGGSKGGLFRSFKHQGKGSYRLHAHVGAGDLTLR